MKSMISSLSLSIDKISEIDRKISQIDEKEPENKYADNTRSMISSLSLSIDTISKINNNISNAALIENSLTHISYVIKILISLLYY